jgi:hypothetical protein
MCKFLDWFAPWIVENPRWRTFVMGRFAPDTMAMSRLALRLSSGFCNPCRLCVMYRLRKPGHVCNMQIISSRTCMQYAYYAQS